ncbi:two-component response regulator-like APRR3 isoform X1 [Gossypium australe]|uniref:Two-component response regulator-like APRR3 isoform X1 n=1 Tax=Gossypium australe TaxID=47621 RepID=A0A5B6W1I7_9ROSI|nr:two-component response regulator-like APRR3 isoform X1 [Gossypium australe]
MVEVGMEIDVEVGTAEETKKKKEEEEEENDESSEVVRWEKFLPQMVLRVLLVEADDSTRQIIAALLRKCSYRVVAAVPDGLMAWETLKDRPHNIDLILTEVELPSISGFALLTLVMEHDICKNIPVIMMSLEDSFSMVLKCMLKGAADFLIKPVRRNELRNLWQHVWRRHTLAGGCAHHSLPAKEHNVEDTAENNAAENNQSSDYGSSTQKIKDESDTQVGSFAMEVYEFKWVSDKLFVSENSKRFVEVAHCSGTCESIALKLEENSAFVDEMAHNVVGLQSDKRIAYVMIGVGCNDELRESSTGAIDLIDSFDKQPMGTFAISSLSDGANKLEFSPQLELSLRRPCSRSAKSQGKPESLYNAIEGSGSNVRGHYRAIDLRNEPRYNNRKSLQPIFLTLDGNRKDGNSSPRQDLERMRMDDVHAGCNDVSPHFYHAKSSLPPACSPKQVGKQEYSPLPVSTSVHSDPDVDDSEQRYRWCDEATNSSNDQTLQGQNKQEPIEELRCSSLIDDQSACSRLCNDVENHEKSCTHGAVPSWSNASSVVTLAAAIGKGTTMETFNNSNCFIHDGLKGMDTHRSSQREAALMKFRLKRKDRCFEKKVRYQNRKRLAEQRPRVKGQFIRQVQHGTPLDNGDSHKI